MRRYRGTQEHQPTNQAQDPFQKVLALLLTRKVNSEMKMIEDKIPQRTLITYFYLDLNF